MKRGPPRLSLWTFSRWHKFLLPTDLNDAVVVIAYLTDKPKFLAPDHISKFGEQSRRQYDVCPLLFDRFN
jgi:hypothetical protein